MNDNKEESKFVGYEYKDVSVKKEMQSVYTDGYENFGWDLDKTSSAFQSVGNVTMKFKRNRKINNKVELTRLEHQFDACVKEIEEFEKSKKMTSSMVAYIVGVIGTALMGGAVFSYLGNQIALCIILAIPAFIGWIAPYILFKLIYKKKSLKVTPMIDQKYDEVYFVCEKAHKLLNIY